MYTQHRLDIDTDPISTPYSYHGQLAMQAARQMTRARSKRQTSHSVCYHLLMMIREKDAKTFSRGMGEAINLLPSVRKKELVQYSLEF
jgi:prophage antirepressor-like protein